MSKITVNCFEKIADTVPAKSFTGDTYQAISEPPAPSQAGTVATFHRVVLNPEHADPKKSLQVHVRSGERNSTDPLRFERVEIMEQQEDEGACELLWYGDSEGHVRAPEPELVLKDETEERDDEQSFEELVETDASREEVSKAIGLMDYRSLADELVRLKLDVPQRRVDRETDLLNAVRPSDV